MTPRPWRRRPRRRRRRRRGTPIVSRLLNYLSPAVPSGQAHTRWLSAILLGLSAVSVGYAIHIRDGEYIPEALKWVTIALALCAAGVAFPHVADRNGWGV